MKNKKPSIMSALVGVFIIFLGLLITFIAYKLSAPLRASEDKSMLGIAFPVIGLIISLVGVLQLAFEIRSFKDKQKVKNFHQSFDYASENDSENEFLNESKENTFSSTHPFRNNKEKEYISTEKSEENFDYKEENSNYSFCPYCGKSLKSKYLYCPYCGKEID